MTTISGELNGTWALELDQAVDEDGRWKYLKLLVFFIDVILDFT